MSEQYHEPEMKVIVLEEEDVVKTSGGDNDVDTTSLTDGGLVIG